MLIPSKWNPFNTCESSLHHEQQYFYGPDIWRFPGSKRNKFTQRLNGCKTNTHLAALQIEVQFELSAREWSTAGMKAFVMIRARYGVRVVPSADYRVSCRAVIIFLNSPSLDLALGTAEARNSQSLRVKTGRPSHRRSTLSRLWLGNLNEFWAIHCRHSPLTPCLCRAR